MLTIAKENKNFYPTPYELANKMIENIDWTSIKTVLEPSAGKGDLVDLIMTKKPKNSKYFYSKIDFEVDCIEIDERLQAMLRGKGYRVVHNNFLTFNTFKSYDLIVMNPPFDNGAKHLLKALDMQKNGGSIVCLLNAETIKNPYSNERKMLINKLNEIDAQIEFLQNQFIDGERKTNVEIALIKVYIPEKQNIMDEESLNKYKRGHQFYDINMDEASDQERMLSKYCAENQYVEMIVEQFEMETRMGLHLIDEYLKFKPHLSSKVNSDDSSFAYYQYTLALYLQGDEDNKYSSHYSLDKNAFLKIMRKKYWSFIFGNNKFVGKLTQNMREELYKRLDEYANYDFSVYNIYTLMEETSAKTIKGIEDTLLALFDELSGKYAWHEELNNKNIHYFNGWKTNKAWYINKKVIVPYLRSNYEGKSKLSDIHKTLSYIAGELSDLNVEGYINKKFDESKERYPGSYFDHYVKYVELPFFDVQFFKKGTAHIIFKDEVLLDKFNLWACQKKNWIPYFYGRKAYKDLNKEEKELVKEFSGSEEKYNSIYQNQNKYLINIGNVLSIGGINN